MAVLPPTVHQCALTAGPSGSSRAPQSRHLQGRGVEANLYTSSDMASGVQETELSNPRNSKSTGASHIILPGAKFGLGMISGSGANMVPMPRTGWMSGGTCTMEGAASSCSEGSPDPESLQMLLPQQLL